MKYKSAMKKEEILEVIVNKFNRVNEKLKSDDRTERDYGEYIAIIDLLKEIEIYEVNERR